MHRLLFAAAVALTVASHAQAAPDTAYEVTVHVTDDGEIVASPTIRLILGGSTQMDVNDCYRLNASVVETRDGRVLLRTQIARPEGEQWVVEASPSITINPDGEAMMMTRSDQWDEIRVSVRPAA